MRKMSQMTRITSVAQEAYDALGNSPAFQRLSDKIPSTQPGMITTTG